jgi:hypothetical protein
MGRADEGTLGRVLTCRDGREAGRQGGREKESRRHGRKPVGLLRHAALRRFWMDCGFAKSIGSSIHGMATTAAMRRSRARRRRAHHRHVARSHREGEGDTAPEGGRVGG